MGKKKADKAMKEAIEEFGKDQTIIKLKERIKKLEGCNHSLNLRLRMKEEKFKKKLKKEIIEYFEMRIGDEWEEIMIKVSNIFRRLKHYDYFD